MFHKVLSGVVVASALAVAVGIVVDRAGELGRFPEREGRATEADRKHAARRAPRTKLPSARVAKEQPVNGIRVRRSAPGARSGKVPFRGTEQKPAADDGTLEVAEGLTPPTGIAADCSKDVTAALLAWIAKVPNGSLLSFKAGGCYRIDAPLRVNDRWGLVFDGNGATFRPGTDGDQFRRHLWFFGGGDLVIRDLKVKGANPHAGTGDAAYRADRETQHGIALQGVKGAIIENVTVTDVYGDFVYVGPDTRKAGVFPWSRNITIRDSTFARNGRQGIAVVAGEDVVIADNSIRDVRRAAFNMEPTARTWGARRVQILRNRTGAVRLFWLSSAGSGSNVSDITVRGNEMLVPASPLFVRPPEGHRRSGFLIEDNTFRFLGNPLGGFVFTRCDDIVIRDNVATFPSIRKMSVVKLTDSSYVSTTGNRFAGAKNVYVADDASHHYTQSGNDLS